MTETEEPRQILIHVTTSEHRRFRSACAARNDTMSRVIRTFILSYIDTVENEDLVETPSDEPVAG